MQLIDWNELYIYQSSTWTTITISLGHMRLQYQHLDTLSFSAGVLTHLKSSQVISSHLKSSQIISNHS